MRILGTEYGCFVHRLVQIRRDSPYLMANNQNIEIYTGSGECPTSSVDVRSCFLCSSARCLRQDVCKRECVVCA